jgi:trans-aconitate methyltransferase
MTEPRITFEDGALYEQTMGTWSRLAGAVFLDWLAPPPGLAWIDVGCGNGAFTEVLVARAAPAEVQGIDPSEAHSPMPARDPARGAPSFARATRWRCPSRQSVSTRPSWRW